MLSSRPALPQHTTTQAENVWNNSLVQCMELAFGSSRSCAENPREMAGREAALSLKLLGFFPGYAEKEFGFASAPSCCCSCGGPQAGSVGRGGHCPCPGLVLQCPCTRGELCHPKQIPLSKASRFWKVWRKQSTGTHLAVANCISGG